MVVVANVSEAIVKRYLDLGGMIESLRREVEDLPNHRGGPLFPAKAYAINFAWGKLMELKKQIWDDIYEAYGLDENGKYRIDTDNKTIIKDEGSSEYE